MSDWYITHKCKSCNQKTLIEDPSRWGGMSRFWCENKKCSINKANPPTETKPIKKEVKQMVKETTPKSADELAAWMKENTPDGGQCIVRVSGSECAVCSRRDHCWNVTFPGGRSEGFYSASAAAEAIINYRDGDRTYTIPSIKIYE